MNQVGVWGGVKIIFEQANRLVDLGAKVTILSHFDRPRWFKLNAEYTQVPFGMDVGEAMPRCDLIVATYYHHIYECVKANAAPVVYFEQGDRHLFDYDRLSQGEIDFAYKQFQLADFVFTVSKPTADLIQKYYDRDAAVIHNAVDHQNFNATGSKFAWDAPYVLIMGSDHVEFKGVKDVLEAFKLVQQVHPQLELLWISTSEPATDISQIPGVGKVFVQPSQQDIAALYRGAEVFVAGSHYESFSLPVLEAMTCGCAVVTTKNVGVLEYAVDGSNALLAEIHNPNSLAEQMLRVIGNEELKHELVQQGLLTAANFEWSVIVKKLAEYYLHCASYSIPAVQGLDEWDIYVSQRDFLNNADYEKFTDFLTKTHSDTIEVPKLYDQWLEHHDIGRWEIAARKKNTFVKARERIFCVVKGNPNTMDMYQGGLDFFLQKHYEQALAAFASKTNEASDPKYKAVFTKWVILCLIELEKDEDALNIAREAIQMYPDYTDIYYLYVVLVKLTNPSLDHNHEINLINTLGDSIHYPEFFFNTSALHKSYPLTYKAFRA
ncbi:glycosyltransferase family 4 protein [Paenibacillus jiagnxiensis]|uniref:glycosyltransferase family 4 protein n=1 Tax=Paenibacillus jiagnxiensis TaxID=3228926 RepID=UPI0033B3DA25